MAFNSATNIPFLNLTDPNFSAQGDELRQARHLSWYAATNYGLAVLRYREVGMLLRDPRLRQGSWSWPAQNGITEGVLFDWWQGALVAIEGEDHARLRRLVNPAFSKKTIERLVVSFRDLAEEIVGEFAADGQFEFMADFAEPYSSRALCRLLGIPDADWRDLSDLAGDLGLAFGPEINEKLPRIETAIIALRARADELVAKCRANPGEDFVSMLVEAADGGDRLSDEEVRELIVQLIFGGMDTTRSQLGLAIDCFVRHPDQWALLADRPELGTRAVEEVIRFQPAINWVTRIATEDFTFEGADVAEGTVLHLMTYAANTDPLAFEGENFDIAAERQPQYGFGGGRHHCLGHFVARTDMREALLVMSRRLPGLAYDGTPEFRAPTGNTGPISLPLKFS